MNPVSKKLKMRYAVCCLRIAEHSLRKGIKVKSRYGNKRDGSDRCWMICRSKTSTNSRSDSSAESLFISAIVTHCSCKHSAFSNFWLELYQFRLPYENWYSDESVALEASCKWGHNAGAENFLMCPHFSLVSPHEVAQRLFVTDWEIIGVSPSVGSAVCTSTGEVGRGAIEVMGPSAVHCRLLGY